MGNEITREMYMGPAGGAELHGPHGQQHAQQQQHEHSEQLEQQLGQQNAQQHAQQQQLGQQQQQQQQHGKQQQGEQDKRQHPNNMQSVRGDQVRPAAEAARARKERLAREKSGASDRIMSSTVSPSQRTMIAAKGRKLFSDFHIAQAEYAQEWGKSQGEEGVADLFQTEAPRLHGLYEIVRAEAAGVTAVVFRGKSLKTGQIVALKFVRIQVKGISDEARRKDCKEEARLQRLCAHENVVNLLDFEVGQKFAIFVLEYVDRTLLQKIVDSNENELYCERTAAKYIRDIALALQKCHARGVVHMDVKLDNILCTAGNVAKLCDFGVAEQMHHPNAPIHRHVAAPLFAPPEVHTLGLCDTAADMWSLGVVLYILLCGYPPFKETELKKRILHARYVFPERDWTQVSVMARDLVSRLLVLDVAQRFTADQVLAHPWIQALSTMPSRAEEQSTAPLSSASHTTSTDGGHFNATKDPAMDKQNVGNDDDVNHAANDADSDKEEDADEEEKEQRQVVSSAASAPLGGHGEGRGQGGQVGPFGPNTNVAATAEVRTVPTKLLDELDTTSVPLPVRVTGFLRRMHHFRELEKRGFDSIPGGEMYRNLLDGVDDIATNIVRSCSPSPSSSSQESVSMSIPSSSVSSIASSQLASTSSWLSRRIDSTLFRETSSSSSTPPHPPSSDSTAMSDDDVFAGAASTLARPASDSSANVHASGDMKDKQQDAGNENDEDDEDDGTESSESPLTEKDLLVQAKFKRRESIVSAAEGMSCSRPRRKSSSATKPPKATQAAPPPRSKRLVREKSFDVQPEEVMDWIDDSEAVSCRICDAEFTLFVRKHHCRNCSNLMCDSCSSHRRRLKILEVKEAVRVCKLCAAHLPNHR